ncbi:MAG: radical SAM protein [bacterium]
MKVLFIRPNSVLRATTFPLGIGYVAEAARRAGHEVSLLDARLHRLCADDVLGRARALKPDVAGISAIHFEKKGAADLARALRDNLDAELVVGGPLVSTSGREFVEKGLASAAVYGEGESAFNAYLEALESGRDFSTVPALIYKKNGDVRENPPAGYITDLDDSLPAWDLINPPDYFRRWGRSTLNMLRRSARSVSVFTSRGCPFGCIYCHNTFGRKFRARSPDAVLDEVKRLRRDYDIRELEIVDDAFNVDLDRAKQIAERLAREVPGLYISFSNGLRADRMDRELIDLLRRAGTYRINYAVETASPRLQKLIKKNLDLDKSREAISYTASRGIFCLGYFMLGFPTETEEEMEMTVEYGLSSKLHAAGIFYVTPFPGTELARSYPVPADVKPALDNVDYTRMELNLSEVPHERLQQISRKFYRDFHFSPGRMMRTFRVVPKNLRTLWSVAVVGILSFRDFGNF